MPSVIFVGDVPEPDFHELISIYSRVLKINLKLNLLLRKMTAWLRYLHPGIYNMQQHDAYENSKIWQIKSNVCQITTQSIFKRRLHVLCTLLQ